LRNFTLYSSRRTASGAVRTKVIPRYPQVEAVEAIIARCKDPNKKQGLIWHHQGSGKTFAMAYAAAKLRRENELDAPTIVIVLDRLELIQQTEAEFKAVGISALNTAETKEQLRQMLRGDARGVIITTIFRFAESGLLNDRSNIIVMVDEAHRTQEGRLGLDMREALPNAKFIGLTGTPISKEDKSNNKKLDFNLGLNYDIRSETSTTYDYYFNFFPAENVPFFLCYGSKLAFVSIPNDSKIVRFPNYSISNKIVIEKIIDVKDWEMWENNEFCLKAVKQNRISVIYVGDFKNLLVLEF
jgi:type I site-specific restriction-modification system R (restriction) subunit